MWELAILAGAICAFIIVANFYERGPCWMCGGTGEVELYGLTVECSECKGGKRI